LKALNPDELVKRTKELKNLEHQIMYYGPLSTDEIVKVLNEKHVVGETLQPVPSTFPFVEQATGENSVLVANYNANQIYMSMYHKADGFDKTIEPIRTMYNSYFGGGMNSIVFQEMREARGLAYSANAAYNRPGRPDMSYSIFTFIATQNDKMMDAIDAFNNILNDMPESEKAFDLAKESIITNMQTQRIIRDNILWDYLNAKRFGYETDARKDIYEAVPAMTMQDVMDFQQKYVKNKPLTYCILGNVNDLDLAALQKIGKVTILTQEDIFGY
jgi:predicted Zn-dependent peptidase